MRRLFIPKFIVDKKIPYTAAEGITAIEKPATQGTPQLAVLLREQFILSSTKHYISAGCKKAMISISTVSAFIFAKLFAFFHWH